ncbi:MAG: hypothetical protein IT293_14385 [Deltaproteobacteria bacterium]|nr:hypothetical protein [Deltaproteobacteria bacterium]
MPELTPTGAVDVVERQVRRVRRRKNLYELQRAFYLSIAVAGGAGVVLLPIALFARVEVFAIAAWSMLVALVVAGVRLAGTAVRRWLSRPDAIAWIEREGVLAGRVRTLLELGAAPGLAAGFFHPLLVSEVGATLPAWTPRRLVPRRVPRSACASALAALLLLAAAVRLASLVSPAAAGPVATPGTRTARAPETAVGDRVIVAPNAPGAAPRDAGRPDSRGPARADSRLTQLSSALQENVREQVWGTAWERVRDALARAGASGAEPVAGEDAIDDAELDVVGADDARLAQRERRGGEGRGGREAGDDREDSDPTAAAADGNEPRDGSDGVSGAGNDTSPGDLFTGASVDTSDTNASFELSLAARMRNDQAGRRQAGGAAPDADPDAHPALAADQRREAAAHRMPIPAAYEQVVREVFAHREEP